MKKRTEIILVIILLILAGLWRLIFWASGVYGSDALYHYSVVEQALAKNELSNDNKLSLCYEGISTGHPHGYYIIPYVLGKFIGLDNAFIIAPVLLGIVTLASAYILIRRLFNKKVALITLFFLAISVAHISKSFPFSWRGENIVYPFLLLSLYFLDKAIDGNKKRDAVIAGFFSGITIWFWNGYPLVIVVYLAAAGIAIGYEYIKKKENVTEKIKQVGLSVLIQGIISSLIAYTTEQSGKGLLFAKEYYPIIIGIVMLGLGVLILTRKYKITKSVTGIGILFIIVGILEKKKIMSMISGFGSIKPPLPIIELQATQMHQYFFAFYILCFTSIAGVIFLWKKFDRKKAMFLGLLLPSLYLVATATRYIYFASIPIITLTGVLLTRKKIIGKKFEVFAFLTICLMILMTVYSAYAIPRYFTDGLFIRDTQPYDFLRENSEKDACIVEISGRGAIIEGIAKRYSYFHPIGFTPEREKKVAELLIGDDEKNTFEIDKLYIVLDYTQLSRIKGMAQLINKTDVNFFRIAELNDEKVNETKEIDDVGFMKYIYMNEKLVTNTTGQGCVYIYKTDYFYLSDAMCETAMFKMITNQTVKNFKSVYFKDGYMIYKYEPDINVVEKKEV